MRGLPVTEGRFKRHLLATVLALATAVALSLGAASTQKAWAQDGGSQDNPQCINGGEDCPGEGGGQQTGSGGGEQTGSGDVQQTSEGGGQQIGSGDGEQTGSGGGEQTGGGDVQQTDDGGGQQTGSGGGEQTGSGDVQQIGGGDGEQTGSGGGKQTGSGGGKQTGDGGGKQTGSGDGEQTGSGGGEQTGDGDGQQTGSGGGEQTGSGGGQQTGSGGGKQTSEGGGKQTGDPRCINGILDSNGDGKISPIEAVRTGALLTQGCPGGGEQTGSGGGKQTGSGDGKQTSEGGGKQTGDGDGKQYVTPGSGSGKCSSAAERLAAETGDQYPVSYFTFVPDVGGCVILEGGSLPAPLAALNATVYDPDTGEELGIGKDLDPDLTGGANSTNYQEFCGAFPTPLGEVTAQQYFEGTSGFGLEANAKERAILDPNGDGQACTAEDEAYLNTGPEIPPDTSFYDRVEPFLWLSPYIYKGLTDYLIPVDDFITRVQGFVDSHIPCIHVFASNIEEMVTHLPMLEGILDRLHLKPRNFGMPPGIC